jgi:hypothetical protein
MVRTKFYWSWTRGPVLIMRTAVLQMCIKNIKVAEIFFYIVFFGDTLISNNILHGVMSGDLSFIFDSPII